MLCRGGGGHSPEAEQLTWDVKVTTGSAQGHMLEYATRMSAAHLTAGKGFNVGGPRAAPRQTAGGRAALMSASFLHCWK